jgi:hypothetical protein
MSGSELVNPSGGITVPLPVNQGGTGSTTQNFVDLTTGQSSIGGSKGFTSPVKVPDGTAAAPGITPTTQTNMGMYRSGSNVLGLSSNGTAAITMSASGVVVAAPRVLQTTDFYNIRSWRLGTDYIRDAIAPYECYTSVIATTSSTAIKMGDINGAGEFAPQGFYPRSAILDRGTASEEYVVVTSAGVLNATDTATAGYDVYDMTITRGYPIGGGTGKAHSAGATLEWTDNSTLMNGYILPTTSSPAIISFIQGATSETADPIKIFTPPRGSASGWAAPSTGQIVGFATTINGKNFQLIEPLTGTVLANFTADARTTVAVQYNASAFDFYPFIFSKAGGIITASDIKLTPAGGGVLVKEGTNAKMGVVTLVAGTATVNTTKVTANSRIFLSVESLGTVTVPTAVAVTAVTPATSFVITSANVVDTSVISWLIIEPAA